MKIMKSLFIAIVLLVVFTQIKAQNITPGTSINNVVNAYYGVKNALTTDNNSIAQIKARELLASIIAVPMNKLTTDQHKIWMAYTDKLQFDSRHISESAELEHQREHFTSLSKNLYEVLKGLKMNTTIIYAQYCPMKKAWWLSETSAIKNPYLGKQMLTCGKTMETLTPVNKY
jgi:hypothetical protein